MSVPLVLSSSAVSTYLRCGQQYYFAYIERIKDPPNIKKLVGIATHAAAELNMVQKVTSKADLPVEQLVDEFSDRYDAGIGEVEDRDEDPGRAKDSGIGLTKLYRRAVSPNVQPLWVEQEVIFEVNGVTYSGAIDLVDDAEVVRDLKTSTRSPTNLNTMQLVGYAMSYRQATADTKGHRKEAGVALDYLIRKKRPEYVKVEQATVTDKQAQVWAEVVRQVAEGINAGRFIPNGLIGTPPACSWCGYKDRCQFYKGTTIK